MRKLLMVLVVLVALGAGGAWAYVEFAPVVRESLQATTVIQDEEQINEQVLVFVRNPYKDDYDLSRLPGYLDNKGELKIVRATLEIELRDSSDNRREVVSYEVRDVQPGSRKTFDANAGAINGPRKAAVKVVELEVVQ
jgi:hypothetical protein